jgi:hypothetical protein
VDSDGEVSRLPAKVEHDFPGIGQRTMLINANRVVRLESSTSKELLHRTGFMANVSAAEISA